MQCILYKIYFWKVFHMYYNLICTPMWTKNFILVKSGCYIWARRNYQNRLVMGRITKWALELIWLDIAYVPQTMIKSQDFVAEWTETQQPPPVTQEH
jgi:hypothetical protein